MSNAYDTKSTFNEIDRCGCGAGLSPYAVNVVHAETGRLVTRFCGRCAADLLSPARPHAGAKRPAYETDLH